MLLLCYSILFITGSCRVWPDGYIFFNIWPFTNHDYLPKTSKVGSNFNQVFKWKLPKTFISLNLATLLNNDGWQACSISLQVFREPVSGFCRFELGLLTITQYRRRQAITKILRPLSYYKSFKECFNSVLKVPDGHLQFSQNWRKFATLAKCQKSFAIF